MEVNENEKRDGKEEYGKVLKENVELKQNNEEWNQEARENNIELPERIKLLKIVNALESGISEDKKARRE